MRGRGDRGGTEQRLEINYSKAINAITTVQKDTMILEKTLDEKKITETIPNRTEQNRTEQNRTERNGTERQNYCHREPESTEGLSGQSEGIKPLRNLSINQGNGLQRSAKDNRSMKYGNLWGFDGGSYEGNVYDVNYISPTIRNTNMPYILEKGY